MSIFEVWLLSSVPFTIINFITIIVLFKYRKVTFSSKDVHKTKVNLEKVTLSMKKCNNPFNWFVAAIVWVFMAILGGFLWFLNPYGNIKRLLETITLKFKVID